MFTETEAREFRTAHAAMARTLNRRSKTQLIDLYARKLRDNGRELLFGGPASKDELVSALLSFDYPIEKLNEAIHVMHHGEYKNDVCEWCRAEADVLPNDRREPPF